MKSDFSTSPNIDIGTVVKMRIHELSTRSAHPRAPELVITVPTVAFAFDLRWISVDPKVTYQCPLFMSSNPAAPSYTMGKKGRLEMVIKRWFAGLF